MALMGRSWGSLTSSLLISFLLAYHGLRRKSLSPAGALTAFSVGFVHIFSGPAFGVTLILFYYVSSRLTKYKQDVKKNLEEDFREGGQRNPYQVLANSLGGCIFAAAAALNAEPALQNALLLGFLGHYCCCCADTWSSELGVLSKSAPRLITTGKEVPKGTNGGVSMLGTAAGAAGGAFMGATFYVSGRFDAAYSRGSLGLAAGLALGLALGLAGTVTDSLLGATLQYTGWDERIRKVVARPGEGVAHICGRAALSNDGVNLTSAALTAAIGAAVGLCL